MARLIRAEGIQCLNCPVIFKPWRKDSKFCSKSCANKHNGQGAMKYCIGCRQNKMRDKFRTKKLDPITKIKTSKYLTLCGECRLLKRIKKRNEKPWYFKKVTMMLSNAKIRCKESGLPFEITREDIVVPDRCPVLDLPFDRDGTGYFFSSMSPSVDRIDSTKGYTKDNIIIVSCRANAIKGDATVFELIKVAKFYRDLYQKRAQP